MAEEMATETKVYGPAREEQRSLEQLVLLVQQALERKGVKFSEGADVEHVLQAAADYLEGQAGQGADGDAATQQENTAGRDRGTIIGSAMERYNGGGSAVRIASRREFVDQTLRDAGEDPLSETELLRLPV